jgi:hypothetical protein
MLINIGRVLIHRFLCVINGNNSLLIFARGIFENVCVCGFNIIAEMLVKLPVLQPGFP